MAIYECRILFSSTSAKVHKSPTRNPVGTNLCAGYSFWTPSAEGGGSSFNNGSAADHRHMVQNTDTLTVVLYDISPTPVQPGTSISTPSGIAFRSKYIGAPSQGPFGSLSSSLSGTFAAAPNQSGVPQFPYAYVAVASGWPVLNVGDFDFSVTFTVNGKTFFMDPEMNVDPGAGK
jgi:hypothetical protein